MIGPEFERFAKALGVGPDDVRLPVTLAALYSAVVVAVDRWRRTDGRDDLLALVDDAIETLAAASEDLRKSFRSAADR